MRINELGGMTGGAFLAIVGPTLAAEAQPAAAALALSAFVLPALHDPFNSGAKAATFFLPPELAAAGFLMVLMETASAGVGCGDAPQISPATHSWRGLTALVCQKLSMAVAPKMGLGGATAAAGDEAVPAGLPGPPGAEPPHG